MHIRGRFGPHLIEEAVRRFKAGGTPPSAGFKATSAPRQNRRGKAAKKEELEEDTYAIDFVQISPKTGDEPGTHAFFYHRGLQDFRSQAKQSALESITSIVEVGNL